MTQFASDPAEESSKLGEGRRMARSLRSQAHHQSHERISQRVRGRRSESGEPAASSAPGGMQVRGNEASQ
jgi:hypothetical protein